MILNSPPTVVHAIALDGAGSTQIAAKKNNTRVTYQTTDTYWTPNDNRPVFMMSSVPM